MARKIGHRAPPPGSIYQRSFKGQEYDMTVVKEAGQLRYAVLGKSFSSPSGAAVAVTGKATNGWLFWRIVDAPTSRPSR